MIRLLCFLGCDPLKRFIIISIVLLLASCSAKHVEEKTTDKIFTTIYPIHFLVTELIGDEVEVQSVYPPGVDAHSYEPTTKEMLEIASGKAFIYLGLGMEGFAEKAKSALKNSDVNFIEIGEHKELFSQGADMEDSHTLEVDPHLWFDPLRMIKMAKIIKNEVTSLFPEQGQTIEENYNQLKKKLQKLDESYQETITQGQKSHILVSHGAYQYWEDRYGIRQIPISGLTSTEEPSQRELANLINQAEKHNIKYVLFERHSSNKTAEIIRNTLKAKKAYIHNLEVLFDEDIKAGEDYFSLMKENLRVLEKALQ